MPFEKLKEWQPKLCDIDPRNSDSDGWWWSNISSKFTDKEILARAINAFKTMEVYDFIEEFDNQYELLKKKQEEHEEYIRKVLLGEQEDKSLMDWLKASYDWTGFDSYGYYMNKFGLNK